MSAPLVTPSRDAAVEALARHKYETFDSHYSMFGGFTWEAYKVEDPQGADFYRTDAACEIGALIASGAVIDAATLADDVRRAITEHADHMEGYTLPGLQQGFLNGWDHALRLLRRDAGFIASRLTTALVERGEQHG